MPDKRELDQRIEELKKRFSDVKIGDGLQNKFGKSVISDDVKRTMNKAADDLNKIDIQGLLLSKLKHYQENPEDWKHDRDYHKCYRCGKEFYLPKPTNKELEAGGIHSWTSFVKQYAKHKGWYELTNLYGNLVCPDCLKEGDSPNEIILDRFIDWYEWYNQWRNLNNK